MFPENEQQLKAAQITLFKVRAFQSGDSEAVDEICRQSPQAAQWPKESYDRAHSDGQIILVAELNERVSGFVIARIIADEAEILNAAVDPAHRRKGIGSALMTMAIATAHARDAKSIYLEVRESNSRAIAFYVKHGFEKISERLQYYRSPTENAVVMQKLTG